MVTSARSRVRADPHRAYGQRRRRLHDRAHEADLIVELPALRRGQLTQRFDGDGELAAGAPLMPHPADYAVDEQYGVVPGLARGVSARVAAAPGYSRSRGWPATAYASK